MRLELRDHAPHRLAAELRRAFSGIVTGNVKEQGIRRIEEHGPFELHGDREVFEPIEGNKVRAVASIVAQKL